MVQRPSVATLRAIGAARFTRAQARPDEIVRLDEGTIVLTVERLTAGERFRVQTDDAEVEVRGTRFQVSASRGKLTAVTVSSGRVEVRSPGGGHVLLDPGDEWVRGADEPETARHRVASTIASSSRHARPSPPSFDRAWSLLRQGDARQAATLFEEVVRTAGDRDIAEDALYWWAVATTKAGDRAGAQAIFERFLRRFPTASRAGEAAVALGWLYVEDSRLEDARGAFERAASDPSAAVRASAQRGLQRTTQH
jgi:TolA-binding protein